jgi:SAM-dependent methyltransferase
MNNRENSASRTYNPKFFAKIAKIEDRHFWFCARSRIIAAAARNAVGGLPTGYRVLDVGCGTGTVLRQLAQVCREGQVTGMDLYPEAAAVASQRAGCRVIVGDILSPPDLGELHVITMFDVLEHFPNDRQILGTANRMLKHNGVLILTVPAHMSLWSYFDVAAHHCRRYDSGGLTRLLLESGFEVEYLTEFMMGLFPLIWLLRRVYGGAVETDRERATEKAASELTIVPVINSGLKFIFAAEAFAIRRRWRLPIGTSLLAVARKA